MAKRYAWKDQVVITLIECMERCGYKTLTPQFKKPADEEWNEHWRNKRDEYYRKELLKLSTRITLDQLLECLERKYTALDGSHYFSQENRAALLHLEKIGLTRIDSIILPQRTVNIQKLQMLPREQLLKLDATVVFGERFSGYNREKLGLPPGPRLTIDDFLKNNWVGTRTWPILRQLGFNSDDAPKLADENDPQEVLARKLVTEEKLSLREARKIATIAIKRRWE